MDPTPQREHTDALFDDPANAPAALQSLRNENSDLKVRLDAALTDLDDTKRQLQALQLKEAEWGEPPPQDSAYGWVVVICAFTVQFTVLGAVNSFGALLKEFETDKKLGLPSAAASSAIFSLANGLLPVVGAVAGKVVDRYGSSPVLTLAGVMLGGGLLLSSYCESYISLLAVFGTTMGIASGCTIAPGLAAVGEWFDKKRALAFGIVYAGSGLGTTGVPLLGTAWIGGPSDTGENWRNVFRKLALLSIPCIFAGLAIKRRLPYQPPHPSSHMSWREIFTNTRIIAMFFIGLCFASGFFTMLVYIPSYAKAGGTKPYENRAELGDYDCTWLLGIFGLMQSVGNVFWGDMSRRMGNRLMFKLSHFMCGLIFISWPWCNTFALQATFSGAEGFFVAGCLTCYPALAAEHFAGPQLGTILSIIYMGLGAGGMIGPPVSGAMIDAIGGSYMVTSFYCATMFFCALALVLIFVPEVVPNSQPASPATTATTAFQPGSPSDEGTSRASNHSQSALPQASATEDRPLLTDGNTPAEYTVPDP